MLGPMAPRVSWSERDDSPTEDHIVHLHDVSWEDYERILEIRGDRSAPRIAYLKGELEIMSPSRNHECIKSHIARLVEVWCFEQDVEFAAAGSWTLKKKKWDRGAEPDECYNFGVVSAPKRPDLAIEVEWTWGRLDKLEIYRKLGVREVWYWRKGRIRAHALRGERYVKIPKSEVLPGINLVELASFIDRPTTSQAMREYRQALHKKKPKRARS